MGYREEKKMGRQLRCCGRSRERNGWCRRGGSSTDGVYKDSPNFNMQLHLG